VTPGLAPGQNGPSVLLPLRFMVTGVLALCIGAVVMFLRPDLLATYHYNQYVIGVTTCWCSAGC